MDFFERNIFCFSFYPDKVFTLSDQNVVQGVKETSGNNAPENRIVLMNQEELKILNNYLISINAVALNNFIASKLTK